MFKWYYKFRIALLHAKFHKNLKRAENARYVSNFALFRDCIYKAEDAWRKLVILTEKIK